MADEQGSTADADREPADGAGDRVGRRRLLRTGIAVGAGAAILWGLGADYVTSDDLGTITYALARPAPDAGGLEPRTREVSVAWHESLRLAFGVQERIHEAGLSSILGSFVVPGDYDDPEASISVDATDESVADSLEDVAEDVTVDVTVVEELPPRSGDDIELADVYQVSDLDTDAVPGGIVCKAGDSLGTLAPALFDAERDARFFATSNHVYGAAGTLETDHRGEPLSVLHEDQPRRVGTVRRGYPETDLVRIAPVDGVRPAAVIERAAPPRVIGQYTQVGLADLMARDEPIAKLGALSGRTEGSIHGVNGLTCYTGEVCKSGQLKWGEEGDLTDGDSGSVNYRPDPENPTEYVLVGGINNARTWWPGASFVWGTAAHRLLDAHGLHF